MNEKTKKQIIESIVKIIKKIDPEKDRILKKSEMPCLRPILRNDHE